MNISTLMLDRKARANQTISYHVAEIVRLMAETAPEGAQLTGFSFSVSDGEPHGMWGSAKVGGHLANMRPGVYPGWRVQKFPLGKGLT